MAAGYSSDATLVRNGQRFVGQAIAAYFETVPGRLGPERVEIVSARSTDEGAEVSWRIGRGSSGTDTYVLDGERIVEQIVTLDEADF